MIYAIIDNLGDFVLIFKVVVVILFLCLWFLKSTTIDFKIFTIYLIAMTVLDLTVAYFAFQQWDNLFMSHFYFIGQFAFLSMFYHVLLFKKQRILVKVLFFFVSLMLLVYFLMDTEKLNTFSLFEILITTIPIIVYTLMHMYNSLTIKQSYVYVNTGILIYTALSTLVFFLGDFLSNALEFEEVSKEFISNFNVWNINVILLMIFQIFISLEAKNLFLTLKNKGN
jgi:hypothetical protein